MKIVWLGQAGLMIEAQNKTIMIDPYLSDNVALINPKNKRRVEVDKQFLKVKPDIIILTHSHADHTDIETLKHFLSDNNNILVLASKNAWELVRKLGGNNNYVLFNRHTQWTVGNISFRAVKAEHSDEHSVGVIINIEGKCLYVTGDTLFNNEIFKDLPSKIDYVFLPINGCGNNMNMIDATAFCERLNTTAIPMHCGLFDNLDMNDFPYKNKMIPQFFKEIKL